jgi:hypothetical protein
MTDSDRAELALAVGRRVRRGVPWRLCLDGAYWLAAGLHGWRPYDPTVPGEDSAEAEAWLAERCVEIRVRRDMNHYEATYRVRRASKTLRAEHVVLRATGATPAEARARIIAAWPEDER